MRRVTGIGGIFIEAKNRVKLRRWYAQQLGLMLLPWGASYFPWGDVEKLKERGMAIWALFSENTDYCRPSRAGFMMNFRLPTWIISSRH